MNVEEFVEYLAEVRKGGAGYSACCPAHEDKSPSLSVGSGADGQVLLTCHAGCAIEEILEAIGLERMDLFPEHRPPTTVAEISNVKRLPEEFLRKYGVDDAGQGIRIPYWYSRTAQPVHKTRRSLAVSSSRWPPQVSVMAYGRWSVEDFAKRPEKRLIFAEGESDAWTGWFHNQPVVSFPGAKTVRKALTADLLQGIERVDVLQEPDQGGVEFVDGVAQALAAHGWKGSARVFRLSGVKDLSELHMKDPEGFASALGMALSAATPLKITYDQSPLLSSMKPQESVVAPEAWPVPKPLSALRRTVPNFAAHEMLPDSLSPWIQDEAERMGVPLAQVAAGAMLSLSTIVGRKVVINPAAHDSWVVVPNLWAAIVAPSGSLKTPALQAGLRPILALDEKSRADFEAHRAKHELAQIVAKQRLQKIEADVKKSLEKGIVPPSHLVEEVKRARDVPRGPRRHVTNDTTVEALSVLLQLNPNGILILRDELLGLLLQFDKPGHENDRQFYLEGWSGLSSFTTDRVGRGTIHVPALRLSVAGTIQKEMFRQLVRRNQSGSDGLLQRFQLLIDGEMCIPLARVDRAPDLVARDQAMHVFQRLNDLDVSAGAGPTGLRFATDAQPLFDEFFDRLDRKVEAEASPLVRSHLTKYRSLIPSLALLAHLADHAAGLIPWGPVSVEAVSRALKFGQFLEGHARELMSSMPDRACAEDLAIRLTDGSVGRDFTERELYRRDWKGLEANALRRALHLLESLGWVRRAVSPTAGRPATVWQVNPGLTPELIDL